MAKIGNYLEEVGKEMRKVTWPTQKELISHTVVTIVATIVISLFIFGTDRIISTVLEVIYG
ncbi:MAG: preprotein translocase subunit SecE [Bacteroidetes Order II. Incertae sedis bacterium]|jgi:preprotein translocase subunit SecE|nr:preprotein translocase subunit SecE [Bacteroidetes Order II. bacterium]MDG1755128.1 preprotein translocase subunit SecE [Rhodothermales bacterium]MBT4602421.1 preprotein translocase subunit SecE [Bacteroidetes Order II. bacterium]MBT5250502.1 preprotein translocase subunit SecE [Bacteroidetes Order II. bacterium]MBT6199989.1 preprotein translocase subunit SecE [Bacteroidetes Order II. bacterium]